MVGEEQILEAFSGTRCTTVMNIFAKARECIAAVRVAKEVLEGFGLTVEPVPVRFTAYCRQENIAYVTGYTDAEAAKVKAWAATFTHLKHENGWNGHLIAVINRRWLLDPTICQANAVGLRIDSMFLVDMLAHSNDVPDDPLEIGVSAAITCGGQDIEIEYVGTQDMKFLKSEAWETDATMMRVANKLQDIIRRAATGA